MIKLIPLLLITTLLSAQNLVHIKYRPDPVDIDNGYFKCIETEKSSFIQGACYDNTNKYMIINLKGTNYHYCSLDVGTWQGFKVASSFGRYYHRYIKGEFDCRVFPVARY